MVRKMLGDVIESLLTAVGVTHERVEKYIWDCGCRQRKERFNRVHAVAEQFAKDVVAGAVDAGAAARIALLRVVGADSEDPGQTTSKS